MQRAKGKGTLRNEKKMYFLDTRTPCFVYVFSVDIKKKKRVQYNTRAKMLPLYTRSTLLKVSFFLSSVQQQIRMREPQDTHIGMLDSLLLPLSRSSSLLATDYRGQLVGGADRCRLVLLHFLVEITIVNY